jgi:retron-type reverse transcriptase
VFFDIEKAFDKISRQSILNNLCKMGFHGNMVHFVLDFLSFRKFRVRIGATLSTIQIQETGTPQGSVISPLLFILALNTIKEQIPKPVNHSLFADDLAIYLRGESVSTTMHHLQKTIENLEKWAISALQRQKQMLSYLLAAVKTRKHILFI